MAWSAVPVAAGALVEASQVMEVRAAIIERRRATGRGAAAGFGDPPAVAAGDICAAATIDGYRLRIEDMLGSFVNTLAHGRRWTKEEIIPAALGAGRTDWTTAPERAGGLVEDSSLAEGTLMYAEHLNDMKAVLDLLYLLPLEEKEGRMYCTCDDGETWTWSQTEFSPTETAGQSGNRQLGVYGSDRGASVPYDFEAAPIGGVSVAAVRAKWRLEGSGQGKSAKFINFVDAEPGETPPSDRDWQCELRMSSDRPADSPRGEDTEAFDVNNLADDGTHASDSSATGLSWRQVYIEDAREMEMPAPGSGEWPFWVTCVLEEYGGVVAAYADEAIAAGQELQIWAAGALVAADTMWAEVDFEYLER